MVSLDLQSRTPIYQQLVNGFSSLCLMGILKAHDKLPSVRSLAIELCINPNTVQKAYQILEAQGITYSVEGKGSFVSPESQMESEGLRSICEKTRYSLLNAKKFGLGYEQAKLILDDVYSNRKEYDQTASDRNEK